MILERQPRQQQRSRKLRTRKREKTLKMLPFQRRRGMRLNSKRKLKLPRLRELCFTKLETLKKH